MAKKENRPVIMLLMSTDGGGEKNRLTVTFEIELSTFSLSLAVRGMNRSRPESQPTARHSIKAPISGCDGGDVRDGFLLSNNNRFSVSLSPLANQVRLGGRLGDAIIARTCTERLE